MNARRSVSTIASGSHVGQTQDARRKVGRREAGDNGEEGRREPGI